MTFLGGYEIKHGVNLSEIYFERKYDDDAKRRRPVGHSHLTAVMLVHKII